jgi:hypothetical protein
MLHAVVVSGHRDYTTTYLRGHDLETAKLLVRTGANVNARDAYGLTPLHTVVDPVIIKFLLKNGANPRLKDARGMRCPWSTPSITSKVRAWSSSDFIGQHSGAILTLTDCFNGWSAGNAMVTGKVPGNHAQGIPHLMVGTVE